jgi:ABC-type antimicrobial peptide transport system permease subunit
VREFGVRLALGAKTSDIRLMVLRYGLLLAGAGVLVGAVAAVALMRVLQKLLFGVTPFDVPTIASVIALLTATALVAALLPARRATSVDPMLALRGE